ncbi:MAG: MBL fold metallo-hydrolase [Pseudomonadota bacterium]
MSDTLSFRILGCGSSGGVPRLSDEPGGNWGECDPNEPKNKRRRCSVLVTRKSDTGETRVLIDTTPDMREQLIDANIGSLDAVVFTHAHADHTHGIDDLRMIVFNMRQRLTVYADAPTTDAIKDRFGYAFVQPPGSNYPPICDLKLIDGPFTVGGAGGDVPFTAVIPVIHGAMPTVGFKIANSVYMPDVAEIPDGSWPDLLDLDLWIIDALRRDPHPTHTHLERTLGWIAELNPTQAVLTNMHIDLDYATIAAETPDHIVPAYDGMTVTLPID